MDLFGHKEMKNTYDNLHYNIDILFKHTFLKCG